MKHKFTIDDYIAIYMKSRSVIFSVLILIAFFLIFLIRRWHEPLQKEAFDRHPTSLIYTHHALCRMDCRHISRKEINEIIEKGIINFNKSNKQDRPCPTFALQSRTAGGEYIR